MDIMRLRNARDEGMIYTRFTDHVPTIRGIYSEYAGSPSNVITTMAAGWPLVFQQWGGRWCFGCRKEFIAGPSCTRKV